MKWIVKMMLVLLLCLPVQSWAFPNEPNGFRDLYWGESLEEVQRTRTLRFIDTNNMVHADRYWADLREDEETVLSGIPIDGKLLGLAFQQNKLIAVGIIFQDIDNNWDYLKGAMERLYGPATFGGGNYVWPGNQTVMLLERDFSSHRILLSIIDASWLLETVQKTDKMGW